jgi:pimeloyl-ACP methyl ester carboxylesterase
MAGDMDIIRSSHSLEIFDNLPRAHLAILPGQTHWAPATDPVIFNALLERFFSTPFERPTSQKIMIAELGGSEE